MICSGYARDNGCWLPEGLISCLLDSWCVVSACLQEVHWISCTMPIMCWTSHHFSSLNCLYAKGCSYLRCQYKVVSQLFRMEQTTIALDKVLALSKDLQYLVEGVASCSNCL